MRRRTKIFCTAASLALLSLAGCGIIFAPFTVPAVVAQNATFNFKGTVVNPDGVTIKSVLVTLNHVHHVFTPFDWSADVSGSLTRRVDGPFAFNSRGTSMDITFVKDGYHDAVFHFTADTPHDVHADYGTWPNVDNFPVVMMAIHEGPPMVHSNSTISYANYPIADAISIDNLATDGRTGDTTYAGKDATDVTVFPPGTLYLTLEKQDPTPLNAKGDIDINDVDLPHHVTLHLPGAGNGFLRIEPRVGYYPMATATTAPAPAAGYANDLTIARARLKQMRISPGDYIIEAHEYFFFRANNRYGKGFISWANRAGKPTFRYELFVQPVVNSRDLDTPKVDACGG